jgi:hypothetical protein
MNKCFHNLSGVMNSITDDNTIHSDKVRVRHILRKLKGDFTPTYIVVVGHSVSIVSNYMLATHLLDNIDCDVYAVWFDRMGDMWHVVQQ